MGFFLSNYRKDKKGMSQIELVSTEDAAKILGISRSQIYLLIKSGKLGSVSIGKSRRISRYQIIEFVKGLEKVKSV